MLAGQTQPVPVAMARGVVRPSPHTWEERTRLDPPNSSRWGTRQNNR